MKIPQFLELSKLRWDGPCQQIGFHSNIRYIAQHSYFCRNASCQAILVQVQEGENRQLLEELLWYSASEGIIMDVERVEVCQRPKCWCKCSLQLVGRELKIFQRSQESQLAWNVASQFVGVQMQIFQFSEAPDFGWNAVLENIVGDAQMLHIAQQAKFGRQGTLEPVRV